MVLIDENFWVTTEIVLFLVFLSYSVRLVLVSKGPVRYFELALTCGWNSVLAARTTAEIVQTSLFMTISSRILLAGILVWLFLEFPPWTYASIRRGQIPKKVKPPSLLRVGVLWSLILLTGLANVTALLSLPRSSILPHWLIALLLGAAALGIVVDTVVKRRTNLLTH